MLCSVRLSPEYIAYCRRFAHPARPFHEAVSLNTNRAASGGPQERNQRSCVNSTRHESSQTSVTSPVMAIVVSATRTRRTDAVEPRSIGARRHDDTFGSRSQLYSLSLSLSLSFVPRFCVANEKNSSFPISLLLLSFSLVLCKV